MRRKYSWIIQAYTKKNTLQACAERELISIWWDSWSFFTHEIDITGDRVQPVLFACLKICQLFLSNICHPSSKSYFHSGKWYPFNEAENGDCERPLRHFMHFLWPAFVALAEINVEWNYCLNCILTGHHEPLQRPRTQTDWGEMAENERDVRRLSSSFPHPTSQASRQLLLPSSPKQPKLWQKLLLLLSIGLLSDPLTCCLLDSEY